MATAVNERNRSPPASTYEVHQQHQTEQGAQVAQVVLNGSAIGQRHLVAGRHDHHQVWSSAVGAIGTRHLPVREITGPHQHGHTRIADLERNIFPTLNHIGHCVVG